MSGTRAGGGGAGVGAGETAAGAGPALALLRNAVAIDRARVPRLSFDDFRAAVVGARGRRERVVALFAAPASGAASGGGGGGGDGALELWLVLANDHAGTLRAGTHVLSGDAWPSFTPDCAQVHLFEREIAEEWGLRPEGHPWSKPVRYVAPRPGGRSAKRGAAEPVRPLPPGTGDLFRVKGDEVHEVAVGPVHAGIIEPGHFRFQCHGEKVFHLEIALGYQHRGVERALLDAPSKRVPHYLETIAGDTTIGHATAGCQALEALAGVRVPPRALALRGIGLELERLANHTGGLGALANDVAFLPTASICGSRFGRGLVRPGGVAFDLEPERARDMEARLAAAAQGVRGAVDLLWTTSSVGARFEGTGRLTREQALELGLVGVAARACGLESDVRHSHPAGFWQFVHVPVSVWHTGDVAARAHVRWLEIQRSLTFVREELGHLPGGGIRAAGAGAAPGAPDRVVVSLVEGWRGEICHVAVTGRDGRLAAYKIVDPSFHNWTGLAMALRDEEISDFPLCNKSFDLSYCGFDL